MNKSIQRSRKLLIVASLLGTGLIISSCESMQDKPAGMAAAKMESSMTVEGMTKMAMGNMEKLMMLSPDEQQSYVMASQQKSMKHGQELFADSSLGTNGFTCATCHPKGDTTGGKVPMGKMEMAIPSLLGVASTFPKFKPGNDAVITLEEMNNNCVVMFLKGKPIPLGSMDGRDLAFFVTNLSRGIALDPGKQSMGM